MGEMLLVEKSITSMIEARVNSEEFSLPVFNRVALEVQQAINDGAEMATIEGLILKDPGLATEILRVANSAFFAGLSRQQNVRQALVRLGTRRTLSLVLMTAQKQAFQGSNVQLGDLMEKLWTHAAASATGCRWLALKCGFPELAESAFLAGLFHDLGNLVVLKALDEIIHTCDSTELTEPVIAEVFTSLHAAYGFRIMQAWHLPQQYADIALKHHETDETKDTLLMIVRLADAACAKTGIGMYVDEELVLEAVPEAQYLGVKDVHLAELQILLEELADSGF